MSVPESVDGGTEPVDHPPTFVTAALAALCAAAGVVHLVMVPTHSQDSTLDGILFLLAGWAQLGLAVGLLAWPRRSLVAGAIAVNLATAAAWVVSRTAGLPWGAHSGEKEAAGTLDQMTTGFEVAAVVLAALVLLRPNLWRAVGDRVVLLGAIVPVAVVVATSVVLTAPETADHHANDAASDDPAATLAKASARCDLAMNPAAYWEEATIAGYDTVAGTSSLASAGDTAAPAGGHSHGGAPAATPSAPAPKAIPSIDEGRGSAEVDRLLALSTQAGEAAEARLVIELAKVSDESYDEWLRRVGGSNTHAGPQQWTAMTDPENCATLEDEIATASEFVLAHPHPADAVKAGYYRVTGYVPGIAAHYMNFSYVDDKFELDKPEMLLYDGTGDDANVVGSSYYISMGAELEPTQGFTGDNDRYHAHIGLCVGAGGVIGDSTTTEEECADRGGIKSGGSGNYMSHFWGVPGCESPWGVFSGANPLLDGELGKQSGKDGGACAGSAVRDRYDLSPGDRTNTPATVTGELAGP